MHKQTLAQINKNLIKLCGLHNLVFVKAIMLIWHPWHSHTCTQSQGHYRCFVAKSGFRLDSEFITAHSTTACVWH